MSAPRWYHNVYATPLPDAPAEWISQAEIVARIEAARLEPDAFDSRAFGPMPEPRPLPVGVVGNLQNGDRSPRHWRLRGQWRRAS